MDIHWKQKHTGDMQVRQNNGVTYLSYPRLEQESAIVHGFSTRLGGVSEGYLGSMNLSFSRGDNPENQQSDRISGRKHRYLRSDPYDKHAPCRKRRLRMRRPDTAYLSRHRRSDYQRAGCNTRYVLRRLRPLIFLRSNPQSHWSVPFRLAGNRRKHRKSNRRSHAESLSHRSGRPHRSHRSLHLPGLLRSKRRRHRRIPPGLSGNPPQKTLLPETQRKVPAKPLGSLPPELPHQWHM